MHCFCSNSAKQFGEREPELGEKQRAGAPNKARRLKRNSADGRKRLSSSEIAQPPADKNRERKMEPQD
jgi:hypothetical protein